MSVPIPDPDGDSAPFWAATCDRRLIIQECERCQTRQFYPRAMCTGCGATGPSWIDCDGGGRVYSFTEVHRAPAAFRDEVPYVVLLVDLDEGVRMMTRLVGDSAGLAIGARVRVQFGELEQARDDLSFRRPYFELETLGGDDAAQ